MKIKVPAKPLQIGDVVTIGRSNSNGIWQITGFETPAWNPTYRWAVLRRLANTSFKPGTAYTRRVIEDHVKLIDLAHIKDHLQKKLQKQLTAIDALVVELNKQGIHLP